MAIRENRSFRNKDLTRRNFAGDTFIDCKFDGADMTGVSCAGATFRDCTMKGIICIGTDFTDADLAKVDFGETGDTDLRDCILSTGTKINWFAIPLQIAICHQNPNIHPDTQMYLDRAVSKAFGDTCQRNMSPDERSNAPWFDGMTESQAEAVGLQNNIQMLRFVKPNDRMSLELVEDWIRLGLDYPKPLLTKGGLDVMEKVHRLNRG